MFLRWGVVSGFVLLLLFFVLFYSDRKSTEILQNSDKANYLVTGLISGSGIQKVHDEAVKAIDNTCSHFLENVDLTEQAKELGLEQIRHYLRSIYTDFPHLDMVFHLSGINLPTGRELASEHETFNAPPYFSAQTTFAKHEAAIIDKFIETKNADELTQSLYEGTFNNYAYWGGDKFLVFVSAHIIQTQKKSLAEQLISKLLSAGIIPHYSDLVIAAQFHINVGIIRAMFDAGRLRADTTLTHFGAKSSLLVMAVLSDNFDAAQLWLSLNSPVEPDHYAPNALDYLLHRRDKYSKEQLRALSLAMLQKGASPNHSQTQGKLIQILTESEREKYAGQLLPDNRIALSQQEKAKVDSVLNKLYEISGALFESENNNADFKPCRERMAKQVLQQLVKHYESGAANSATPRLPTVAEQDDEALIEHIRSQFTEQREVEQALNKERNGIEAKQLIEKYRLQLANEKVKSELAAHGADPGKPEDYTSTDTDKLVLKLQQLAAQGAWQEALLVAEQLKADKADAYEILFGLGLLHSAPWVLFESLINKGAMVPDSAILMLTITDNIALAELLFRFGLNLNYRDEFGYSAVANSVLNRAPNILRFLINQGVSVNEPTQGFDALDFALRDFSVKKKNAVYVEMLIKAGAKITTSHKQWVEDKFHTDLESYSYLVSYYPELASLN